jgi:hypothetical protein
MAYTNASLTFISPEDGEIEVEFEINVCSAEPDVGIMGDYIDDWSISAIDGSTDLSDERKAQVTSWLFEEYGDEDSLLEKLAEDLD